MTKKICIVYFSGSGNTSEMAESVRSGAATVSNCEVQVFELSGHNIIEGRWNNDTTLELPDRSDAIIFGTPTYMGSIAAQMKAFMDATGERFFAQSWKDKIAAGFTVSSGLSGDKFNAFSCMATFAMQQGMIWVGLGLTSAESDGTNRLGFYFGAGGQALMEPYQEGLNESDKATGYRLGIRVAETSLRFT